MPAKALILLAGATGNVGARLLPLLVNRDRRVRCLARKPEFLASRVPQGVEVVPGDVLDAVSLPATMQGVEAAYYLVHSIGAPGDFEEQDRLAADNFASAVAAAGVSRIIYLGGLGEAELSAHLRSRHEVGKQLRARRASDRTACVDHSCLRHVGANRGAKTLIVIRERLIFGFGRLRPAHFQCPISRAQVLGRHVDALVLSDRSVLGILSALLTGPTGSKPPIPHRNVRPARQVPPPSLHFAQPPDSALAWSVDLPQQPDC